MLNSPRNAGPRMHCTLLIPGLLTPGASSETTGDLRLAELEVAFARGDSRVRENISCDQWLCDEFGVSVDGDIPAAPLMLKADGGDPQEDFWFCADPVHLRADRSRLVLSARIEDLTGDEAIKLVDTLNKHFSQDRVRFLAPTPRHWYIQKEGVPRMLTTPLAHAMNRSVDGHLPQGDDALEWNRIVNEAQMILHAHPVNEAREARPDNPTPLLARMTAAFAAGQIAGPLLVRSLGAARCSAFRFCWLSGCSPCPRSPPT